MNAREVIAKHLCKRAGQGWSGISLYERGVYRTRAHHILAEVAAAGFTIMSKEDVEAIRDKSLEIVSAKREEAESFLRGVQMAGNDNWSAKGAIAACNDIEKAIRSLKSGGE